MTETSTASISGVRHDPFAEKLVGIAQTIIIAVFGILPVFFIPSADAPLGYTKVLLVLAGLLAALALYGFSVLRAGSAGVSFPLPLVVLWLLVLAALASSLLSGDFRGSFLGDAFEPQTTAFLGVMALTATLAAALMRTRAGAMRFYVLILGSTLLLGVFHMLRLVFGGGALSLGAFGGGATLSPLGSWNDIAIFFGLAILLSLVALEQLSLSRAGKALFAAVAGVALIMLAVINFFAVWVVLGLVSLIVLVYGIAKDRFAPRAESRARGQRSISGISLAISALVFAVSALFIIGGSFLGGTIANLTGISYIEVRPSLQATAEITRNVYGESALFGSGPNTFASAWRLYRDPSINQTIFWNTDFTAGIGYIPTFFTTMGIAGGLLWLAFLALFLFAGIRMLIGAPADADRLWYFIGTSAFVAAAYGWGLALIYVPGTTLLLLTAFTTGLVFAAEAHFAKHRDRSFVFRGGRGSGFVLVAAVMLVVVGSVATLYFAGRHYAAAYAFSSGVTALVLSGDIDRSESLTAQAYALSPDDRYARRIAEIQYARVIEMLNLPGEPTEELQARFEEVLVAGVRAAQLAVAQNGSDANNWGVLGNMYAVLVSLNIEGAYEEAHAALTAARERDPQNPVRLLALGRLALVSGDPARARAEIGEAIRMKSNYAEAILALSQLDIAEGNIDSAIESARRVIAIEPQNPVRYFQLGILELFRADRAEGIRALETAVALQGDYSNARYYLALAYDADGRPADARRELEEVLRLNPGNAAVTELLATLSAGGSIGGLLETDGVVSPVRGREADTETESPVEQGEVPDTPLLSPVNTPPAPPEGDTEDNG